ncbi:MAG TPA: hypothetical protein VF137_11655 [Candidatus Dormibacteraeota bacterium]
MTEDTRAHNPADCDCETCYPQKSPVAAPDLCDCVEDGFRAGLERWKDSCSCCFSEAYPEGIDAAVAKARA